MINIVMCGRGALAKAFRAEAERRSNVLAYAEYLGPRHKYEWESRMGKALTIHDLAGERSTIAIHTGSGSQMPDLLRFCGQFNIPILQASTGQEIPKDLKVPFIIAPNLALPIVALFRALPDFWAKFGQLSSTLIVQIMESHQSTKSTVPGTAVTFSKIFGVPERSIVSERLPEVQHQLGVKNLHRHGYHWIRISGFGMEIQLQTKVDGLEPYAAGGIDMAQVIVSRHMNNDLQPGRYEILEFLN